MDNSSLQNPSMMSSTSTSALKMSSTVPKMTDHNNSFSGLNSTIIQGMTTFTPQSLSEQTARWRDDRTVVNVWFETVTFCVLWLGAVFGNSLVCIVIYRSRRLQSTTNYFVVSLAFIDLTLVAFCMPFILGRIISKRWIFGIAVCKLVRYLQLLVPGCSMSIATSICIDRFYTIIYPLSFKITRGRAKRMVIGSLVLTAIISSPALYFYDVIQMYGQPFCRTYINGTPQGIVYVIIYIVLLYITPIIAMICAYFRIFKYIWRAGVGGRTFQRTTNPVPRAKVKMVKMLVIVSLVVVVLYGPFLVAQVVYCVKHPPQGLANPTVYIAVLWILFSSTVAKPLIYMFYNSNFRRGCKEVFCMSTMKCYRTSAYTITTASAFSRKNYVGIVDYGRDQRRFDSPSKTFDRAAMADKTIWPLSSQTPSTYL